MSFEEDFAPPRRDGLLSISELAKISGLSRSALIYYDRMGLLSPSSRGNNKYRYYSRRQITSISMITTMKDLGMPLKEISDLMRHRTPEGVIKLFSEQTDRIDNEIEKLILAKRLLITRKTIIESAIGIDEEKIGTRMEKEEPILLGPQIDYSLGKTIEEAEIDFYNYCEELEKNKDIKNIDLNYPVWGMFSEERIKKGDWNGPDKFYFRMPDGPNRKPAGLYLVGCTRAYYGHNDALYRRMTRHIEENGLEINGPAYETYPLDEISVSDNDNYLMRIFISVRNK
jgi:DNA-binding transcriptional MerR regulator